MAISKENLVQVARAALDRVGLPSDPKEVVGKTFVFGDGDYYVAGTIMSIGYGPTQGVVLYVSAPRFRGQIIHRFVRKNGGWVAACHYQGDSPLKPAEISGTFALL